MRLLIDADIFMYRAATAAETEIHWGDQIWSLYTDLKDAKAAFRNQIDKVCETLKVKEVKCCLSDHTGNFRKEVDPNYKGNRKGTRKPVGYAALCDWVKETYPSVIKPNLEADDVLGILQTMEHNKGKTIIVSDDKDLAQIPGKLYRPTSGEQLDISEAEADAWFYTQVLCGDQVDNYPGLKGCGPKTAQKILGPRPSWGAVEQAYIKAGQTRDDAIKQARLARILRWTDWSAEEGKVRLWQPE